MKNNIPPFLLAKTPSDSGKPMGGILKIPFIDKGIHRLAGVIKAAYCQLESAERPNFFRKVDARVKVLFCLAFIVVVSLKRDIGSEVLIGAFVFVLVALSRLNLISFYRRVLFFGFIFGFLIALPSALNVITKGEMIWPLLHLPGAYRFWIYEVPQDIGFTREGLAGVAMLTLRVVNSLALSLFLLSTTTFPEIIKSLKMLKIPDGFLMIITLSYQYILMFARTTEDMHLAKKSRMVREVNPREARGWMAGRIAFLFHKTQRRCEEIFKAMLSRGSTGAVKIYPVRKMETRDWAVSVLFSLAGLFFLWI